MKRSFLLLEVLIALALITLLMGPLLEKPFRLLLSHQRLEKKVREARMADVAFLRLTPEALESFPYEKGKDSDGNSYRLYQLTLFERQPLLIKKS